MTYKEMKKLLFDENAKLTSNQAEEILNLLSDTPRAFSQLLKADDERIPLMRYKGFNEILSKHEFEASDTYVFSPKIAKKFFELNDDDISIDFINILTFHSFKSLGEALVFAWPYSKDLADYLSLGVVKTLISSKFFCFDFEFDASGTTFEKFVLKVQDDSFYKEMLAINSFNIASFISKGGKGTKLETMDLTRMLAYSVHNFPGFDDEYAGFRKLFISYLDYCLEMQDLMIQKIKKHQGMVLN